jgi:cell division protein FtsI (penicillin-binding protein 3)
MAVQKKPEGKAKPKAAAAPGRPLAKSVPRMRVMLIVTAMVFSLAAGKAIQVQAIDADSIAAEAAKQITVTTRIPALRGTISDRNGEVLAFSESTVNIIADPTMIRTNGKFGEPMTDKDRTIAATAANRIAELLVQFVGGSVDDYLPALTKKSDTKDIRYAVVAKQVASQSYALLHAAMADAGLIGLSKESAPTRRYPLGTVAANLLGFINDEGVGSGGLELTLNKSLDGVDGQEVYEVSPNGRIPTGSSVLTPAQNGQDYQLTIDAGLQLEAEQILADRVTTTRAKSGSAVVLNVKTGEVLAMANYPTFDPNDVGSADQANVGNRAITDPFTPGSVQKVITMAAVIDAGLVRPDDVITIPAQVKSGADYISDAWKHGEVEAYARTVVVKSSNVGMVLLARKMSKEALLDYYKSFGLGAKTGIGLPGESVGILPSGKIEGYTRDGMAFGGSAIAVTTIQEAAAIAAIANGGVYNQPYLLKSTTLSDGTVQEVERKAPHRVISEEAAKDVIDMMESMASYTTSDVFEIDGYRTGTKTGTTKKFNNSCNCYKGYVTSTVGIAPVENPQLLTYVVIDDPQLGSSGMAVAGPAYQDIMSLAMPRYGVKPSERKSPKPPLFPEE